MRISDWSSDVCSSDLEAFGEVVRDGSLGRRWALAADHLDPVLRLAVQDRRQVTARPIQVRLHDLQREAGGDRRIEGIAAALEDGHADRRGDPVGRRSEEHTSELQSLMRISYAVFCLKKKKTEK